MSDTDDKESVLSKFSNQDPASGGYGEEETEAMAGVAATKTVSSSAAKAKKKKKNKAAKKARVKNRK